MIDTRKPIVIVGSITMDLVTRTPRIPAIGQTLIGTAFETTPGGKGANQAVAAARLGARVAMVAKVGDDAYGPALIENLKRARVDTAGMTQTAGVFGACADVCGRGWFERNCGSSGGECENGPRDGGQPCGSDSFSGNGVVPA